jgi:hypothetical protein
MASPTPSLRALPSGWRASATLLPDIFDTCPADGTASIAKVIPDSMNVLNKIKLLIQLLQVIFILLRHY